VDARVETYLSSVYARARAHRGTRGRDEARRRDRVVRSFAGAHHGRRGIHSRWTRARAFDAARDVADDVREIRHARWRRPWVRARVDGGDDGG